MFDHVRKFLGIAAIACAAVPFAARESAATVTTYSDFTDFYAAVGLSYTDSYEPGDYGLPSGTGSATVELTNAAMNDVYKETRYTPTLIANSNMVHRDSFGRTFYCAGCFGSFELDFSATSLTVGGGVYGVGFSFENSVVDKGYTAYVRFVDGSSANYVLPITASDSFETFALTASAGIATIHFGGADGAILSGGRFGIDDLTIAAMMETSIPAPPALAGILTALLALWALRRRTA